MKNNPQEIKIEEYDYPLPDERIARHPLAERDSCLLLVRNHDGSLERHIFSDIPGLLPADSMLVYNNTRVINARLRFRKGEAGDGSPIEIFCLEPYAPNDYALNFASVSGVEWSCFVGNSKKWKCGPLHRRLTVDGMEMTLTAERTEKKDSGSRVRFTWDNPSVSFSQVIEAAGEIPIPPYLNRSTEASDSVDYQTVYSHIDGSVAAPTAGLHFTDRVLDGISQLGIPRRELTLHVGAGTFQPVKADNIGGHDMHCEFIAVSRSLIAEIAEGKRRVIAVGTTSVRTLESLYHIGCLISEGKFDGEVPQWYPYAESHPQLTVPESMRHILEYLDRSCSPTLTASTRIIIAPGYKYRIVKGMVTNFHQPRSTLLLLVSAFVNGDWRRMYDYALDSDFRFLSYGDAQLLL